MKDTVQPYDSHGNAQRRAGLPRFQIPSNLLEEKLHYLCSLLVFGGICYSLSYSLYLFKVPIATNHEEKSYKNGKAAMLSLSLLTNSGAFFRRDLNKFAYLFKKIAPLTLKLERTSREDL